MSRIGKKPITVPEKVEVKIDGSKVTVKGSKAELSHVIPDCIEIVQEDKLLLVNRKIETKDARALHGLTRSLINNMIVGVDTGFKKDLEMRGVGYRAAVKGKQLVLSVGYSHPVEYDIADGIEISVEANVISVAGADKQQVGQVAAEIRDYRKPEPYKGKGIRYVGEYVIQKEGKSA
ncbi:MAG: 50S ribosomal protein L6 [Lentisphaeria bacterium]|nr:50S ribosomal protein L6 [Lentisphaeria bacterium]NQZ67474.1 50S ribosomal protein L6 [Lentisphaeria bacterium]